MFKIKIADTIFKINNIYLYVEKLCRDYIYEGEDFDYEINSTEEQIDEEKAKIPEENWSRGYIENITVYRAIAMKLLERDAFVMHAAVIAIGDKAYAFTAKSGTGKSTHIKLWRKLRGEEVYVVNGDKPVMRYFDGKLYAYGTPWCGKEGWNNNVSVPLKGICFITRSEENWIEEIDNRIAVFELLNQTERVPYEEYMSLLIRLVENVIRRTHIFKMGCNISKEAVYTAYNLMENPLGL